MDATPIAEWLNPLWKEYQTHLRRSVATARDKHEELVTELALRINSDRWDERFRLVRIDMVAGDPDKPQLLNAEVDPEPLGSEGPTRKVISGSLILTMTKFRWHACVAELSPAPTSWEPVWAWFDRWFDLDGLHDADAEGFESVIHGMSLQKPDSIESCSLVVDFGSAPPVCVEEFADACRDGGVARLKLS